VSRSLFTYHYMRLKNRCRRELLQPSVCMGEGCVGGCGVCELLFLSEMIYKVVLCKADFLGVL